MHRNEQDRNSLVFAGTTVPFSLDVSDLNLLPFSTFLREPNTRKTRGELSWLYTEWSTIFLHVGSSMSWTVKGTWKQVLYNNISKVWCLRLPAQQRSQTVPQRWRMMMAMSEFLSDEVLKYHRYKSDDIKVMLVQVFQHWTIGGLCGADAPSGASDGTPASALMGATFNDPILLLYPGQHPK